MAANDQPQSRSLTLKACPCCGGEARFGLIRAGQQAGGHYIECKGCQLSTSLVFPLKDEVTRDLAERWNKRAPVSESAPAMAIAEAQRESDLKLFAQWAKDVELPFGGTLQGRHTFNVAYEDYVRACPIEHSVLRGERPRGE